MSLHGVCAVTVKWVVTARCAVSLKPEIKREMVRFGANVRRERVARSVTQEKMAELADLNIRTLQRIEAGEINLLLPTVLRIQRALGCSWEKLMPLG